MAPAHHSSLHKHDTISWHTRSSGAALLQTLPCRLFGSALSRTASPYACSTGSFSLKITDVIKDLGQHSTYFALESAAQGTH